MNVGECEVCKAPAIKTGMDIEVKHEPNCSSWEMRRRCNTVTQDKIDSGKCGKNGWVAGDPRNEDIYWEKK